MIVTITYMEGLETSAENEKIIQQVCDEIAEVYGLSDDDEFSVLLCDNQRIHELNKKYRHIDRPTDVLSFALNEGDEEVGEEARHLLGDIVISLEKVAEQAEEYGHSFQRELAYLTVHSCLHILGYDHMTEEDKKEMRVEEEFVLSRLGYIREDESYNE